MTFEVRVKSVDQKSPYAYPSRKIEITTGAGRVTTPNRAATLYEYNKKASVPTNIPLDNDVSLAVKRPNAATLAKFLKENGVARRWGREMRSAARRMAYSALSAYLVQPTTTDVPAKKTKDGKGISAPAVPSGTSYLRSSLAQRERFIRILLQIQVDSGFDVVAVPYLGLPLSEYKEEIRKAHKAVARSGAEPMFVFDLEYQKGGNRFEEAMSFLVRDIGARLVAFPGRSYMSAPVSYDVLAGYAESDVAFVSFDTDRPYQRSNPLSKMHSFPFIGTDIYAIKTPRFVPKDSEGGEGGSGEGGSGEGGSGEGGSGEGGSGARSALDSVKFFEPLSLTIRPSAERVGDPIALLDEIGERSNARLRSMLEEYESARNDPDKVAVLSSLSRVHELKSSTAEFKSLRGWIGKSETEEYVKEKPQLEKTLAELERQRKGR